MIKIKLLDNEVEKYIYFKNRVKEVSSCKSCQMTLNARRNVLDGYILGLFEKYKLKKTSKFLIEKGFLIIKD